MAKRCRSRWSGAARSRPSRSTSKSRASRPRPRPSRPELPPGTKKPGLAPGFFTSMAVAESARQGTQGLVDAGEEFLGRLGALLGAASAVLGGNTGRVGTLDHLVGRLHARLERLHLLGE